MTIWWQNMIIEVLVRLEAAAGLLLSEMFPNSGECYHVVMVVRTWEEENCCSVLCCTGNVKLDFGRAPMEECPALQMREVLNYNAWASPSLDGGDIRTFRASLGPTGGARGYQAITGECTVNSEQLHGSWSLSKQVLGTRSGWHCKSMGRRYWSLLELSNHRAICTACCLFEGHQSWGIAWYINDLLIPEITLRRGYTYTFIVNGGDDTGNPSMYHPFYITDDPAGGRDQKDTQQKMVLLLSDNCFVLCVAPIQYF